MSRNGFTGDPYEDAEILVDSDRSYDVTRVDVRAIAAELLKYKGRGNDIPEGPYGQSLLQAIAHARRNDGTASFPVLGRSGTDECPLEVRVTMLPR